MRRSLVLALLVTVVIALAPGRTSAQSAQRISLQASGLYIKLTGGAFDSVFSGKGAEVQVRFTKGQLSLGTGIQYTTHNRNEENSTATSNTMKLLGFFVEPRYTVDIGSRFIAPYVSARFALSRMSIDIDQEGYQASGYAPGPTINGGGGVLVRLGSRANLDFGATYGYTKYDDLEYTSTFQGTSQTQLIPLGSGKNLVIRVGLAFGLGG